MDPAALDLFQDLIQSGFALEADGEGLRYRPASRATPEVVEAIRAHKADLLAILRTPIFDDLELPHCSSCDDRNLWLAHRGLDWRCLNCSAPERLEDAAIVHRLDGDDVLLELAVGSRAQPASPQVDAPNFTGSSCTSDRRQRSADALRGENDEASAQPRTRILPGQSALRA